MVPLTQVLYPLPWALPPCSSIGHAWMRQLSKLAPRTGCRYYDNTSFPDETSRFSKISFLSLSIISCPISSTVDFETPHPISTDFLNTLSLPFNPIPPDDLAKMSGAV